MPRRVRRGTVGCSAHGVLRIRPGSRRACRRDHPGLLGCGRIRRPCPWLALCRRRRRLQRYSPRHVPQLPVRPLSLPHLRSGGVRCFRSRLRASPWPCCCCCCCCRLALRRRVAVRRLVLVSVASQRDLGCQVRLARAELLLPLGLGLGLGHPARWAILDALLNAPAVQLVTHPRCRHRMTA